MDATPLKGSQASLDMSLCTFSTEVFEFGAWSFRPQPRKHTHTSVVPFSHLVFWFLLAICYETINSILLFIADLNVLLFSLLQLVTPEHLLNNFVSVLSCASEAPWWWFQYGVCLVSLRVSIPLSYRLQRSCK